MIILFYVHNKLTFMKNRLIKEILLWGGIFCSYALLQAQVPGDVANVKFEEVENSCSLNRLL